MGGVGAVGLGGIPAPFFSGSGATGIFGGGGGGAGCFSSIGLHLAEVADILPGAAALATFAVQLILLSAVVLIGAATIRDLLREVRR